MKAITKKRRILKPTIIITSAVIVAALLGVGAYAYFHRLKPSATTHNTPTTTSSSSKKAATSSSTASSSTNSSSKTNNSSDTPPAPTTQSGASKATVGISVTSSNQNGETSYKIATQINTVTNSGTCTLNLSNGSGGSYSQTVNVQPLAETSTCMGFTVPIGGTGISQGKWNYTITYTSDTLTGQTTGSISVQ